MLWKLVPTRFRPVTVRAARNAAHSVESERARRLDDARTMRDLQRLAPAATRPAAQNG